jgi:Mrp family chromosome partitioning ATPase
MGRIAEALKRAQQERAHRLGRTLDSSFDSSSAVGTMRFSGRDRLKTEPFGDLAQLLLDPPPAPAPFPIIAPPILSETVGADVLAFHHPGSSLAEKYRSVRMRLITGNPGGGPRVLAVTSALRGEGKTVTTANLGFSLSELKYLRVAMVDLDFRGGGLSALLGAEDQPGLAEVLRGELPLADVCMPAVRDNLYLVPAGDPAGVPASELLASKLVGSLFKELAERFHYSLIDAPALHDASDTGQIAPLCHSVVMVVRANSTPEPLLQRCVKLLQANRATVAGCILAGYAETAIACQMPDYLER